MDVAGSETETRKVFEREVRSRHQDQCVSCGGDDHVAVHLLVPELAGGSLVADNATLLCRNCDFAARALASKSVGVSDRPVNFWVSNRLYQSLQQKNGFGSVGKLVRFLVQSYLEAPDRFDDVGLWQDEGADVKVNVHVPADIYERFRAVAYGNGGTVTDVLRSLLRWYEEELSPRLVVKKEEVSK